MSQYMAILYEYPYVYNDIALEELGGRIEYDYEVHVDTSSCLDHMFLTIYDGLELLLVYLLEVCVNESKTSFNIQFYSCKT